MNTDRLDPKAVEKINGQSWDALRSDFESINDALLDASESSTGAMTTIYVKYASPETSGDPYAVVWIKKSTEIIVGLSVPENVEHERLVGPPKGCKYAGLNKFVVVNIENGVPAELVDWIKLAYAERCAP